MLLQWTWPQLDNTYLIKPRQWPNIQEIAGKELLVLSIEDRYEEVRDLIVLGKERG